MCHIMSGLGRCQEHCRGNEGKMMHFNHLNRQEKRSRRNSIQVHCSMQLVFNSGYIFSVFSKMFVAEFNLQPKCPIYICDFILLAAHMQLSWIWDDQCGWGLMREEQLSVVRWLSARTHVICALWSCKLSHTVSRNSRDLVISKVQNISGSWHFYPRSAQDCNWSVTCKLQPETCFKLPGL